MAQILVPLHIEGQGQPARLRVAAAPAGGSDFLPLFAKRFSLSDDVKLSGDKAWRYSTAVAGWPPRGLTWTLEALGPTLPCSILGTSLFGALCLASMKAVAEMNACHTWAIGTVGRLARAAAIDRVAVSAAADLDGSSFYPVGYIERKLEALANQKDCAVVIVAHKQEIKLPVDHHRDVGGEYEMVTVPGRQPLPVIRAFNPVDALERICLMQSRSALHSA